MLRDPFVLLTVDRCPTEIAMCIESQLRCLLNMQLIFDVREIGPWAAELLRAYPEMSAFLPGLFCTLWLLLNGVDAGKVIR